MKLQAQLRSALQAAGDAEQAAKMQAYMKSALPYYGVKSAPMRALFKELLPAHPVDDVQGWQRDVRKLWREARYREERYAALALCADRRARAWQTIEVLPLYEELIVTGAWWDLVDEVAAQRLVALLRASPEPMKKAMRAWSRCDDLWKRRASIICQIKQKDQTDLALLYDCIEPSLDSKEFFLRKAIGWALREHSKTDLAEVRRYVRANEAGLSGLSKREALKHA
jgi:3-methyladenine DNA glycosylase AlkD